jgi:hypothetical protein
MRLYKLWDGPTLGVLLTAGGEVHGSWLDLTVCGLSAESNALKPVDGCPQTFRGAEISGLAKLALSTWGCKDSCKAPLHARSTTPVTAVVV